MEYTKESFKDCRFNPMEDGSFLANNKSLAAVLKLDWLTDKYFDKILKYVVMMYDPKSPLVKTIESLKERREAALELVGLGKAPQEIKEQITKCSYGNILTELVIVYLTSFPKSRDWAMLCVAEYKFWETVEVMMQPSDATKGSKDKLAASKTKTELFSDLKNAEMEIDSYFKKIFGVEESVEKFARNMGINAKTISNLNGKNVQGN